MTDYRHEEAFREWADRNDLHLIEPHGDGDPLVWSDGAGRAVQLHQNGAIVLQQTRMLGGPEPGDEVEVHGSRLVVRDERGENRVSPSEFPIDR